MDSSLASGTLVAGRYRVTGVIAEGGMGAVYEGMDERLRRPVALKVVRQELSHDRTALTRFEREAAAAAKLSHPGIVQVHDFGTTDAGLAYLVMERLSGRTLAQILSRDGQLAPERAADLIEQALGALEVAHVAGIVHRDLKPANLMVLAAGEAREVVKLLDFGLARLMESEAYTKLTRTGAILGTPAFMAPEQARGATADHRSDIYAMGVLLYCALTGKKPFDGADIGEVLNRVLDHPTPRADAVAGVPAELSAIAEKAMQRDPKLRFASAREMASALVAWRTRPAGLTAVSSAPTLAAAVAPTLISMRGPTVADATGPTLIAPAPSTHPPGKLRDGPVPGADTVIVAREPAPAPPSARRRWLGRLPWLALALVAAFCVLGSVVMALAVAFASSNWAAPLLQWLPEDWSIPHPRSVSENDPYEELIESDEPSSELGGPSGACARATACCQAYADLYPHAPSCVVLHAYEERPRALCDEVRDRYRASIEQSGGDPSPCD